MTYELVIRGGNVVTPGHQEVADIGIGDGRIAQIGGGMTGAEELDARGLLVIPGGIDAHVHLVTAALRDALSFPVWVDDFWTGSLAALALDVLLLDLGDQFHRVGVVVGDLLDAHNVLVAQPQDR